MGLESGECRMKRTALDWFVCPISKGPLSARSFDEIETDGVIKAGVLTCETSNTWFPIINGMPILLDFVTDIQRQFRDRYQQAHGDFFAKYQLPNGNPRPGEECTQR